MKRWGIEISLIILLGLLTGARAVQGEWHFDDYYTIVNNQALREPSNIFKAFFEPSLFSADPARKMYRPVLVISYILNFAIFGENPKFFLAMNLLLHLINALLIWAIIRELVSDKAYTALIGALIYAVHPACTEGIAYASARSAVLATTFTYSALLCYIKWEKSNSIVFLPLAVLSFVIALGTKSIAIVFFPLVVMYELFFADKSKGKLRRKLVSILVVAFLSVGYMLWRKAVMGTALAESLVRPLSENIFTQARAYFHYFRLYLFPIHQSINPYFPTYPAITAEVALSFLGLATLSITGLFLAFRESPFSKIVGFGMLWILVCLLPESSIIPLNLVVSDRRMILPLGGFAIGITGIVASVRATPRNILSATIIVCYGALTFARLGEWQTEKRAWRSAVRLDPHWALLWNNLGLLALQEKDIRKAEKMFQISARKEATFKEAPYNLGNLYAMRGQYKDAEKMYLEAIKIDPSYEKPVVMLAQQWYQAGEKEKALILLSNFIKKYPATRAYYILGNISHQEGDWEKALEYYRKSADALPWDPLPNLEFAKLAVQAGRREEATYILRRFLSVYKPLDANRREAENLLTRITGNNSN